MLCQSPTPPVRVLLLSTSYPADLQDWRGLFIRHLVHALAEADGVSLHTWAPPGELPLEAKNSTTDAEAQWLAQLMKDGGIAHCIRRGGFGALRRTWQLVRLLRNVYQREKQVDVYHINWLQTALPLPDNGIPAVIAVLGTDMKLLKLPLVTALLRRVMRKRRVVLCPNAEWMEKPLALAFGDLARIVPVAFGIDPIWYAAERRPDPTASKWLVVSRLTRDKLGPLFEWSAPLFEGSARQLHLIGPMQEAIVIPDWVHYHGPATPAQLASEWFPFASGLITLSRHAEGRPQVMLEAMAAALPIIASDMPAHASLVQPGITGQLCGDPEAFKHALTQLEDADCNHRFGAAARAWVSREMGTWTDCAERYASLYAELTVSNHG
jgi:glycosyltransferase involved in cell wall biosynthesis